MTYCKGLNKEELELYRERILRYAKPRTAENYFTGWDEKIEYFRQSHYEDEELNYALSVAPEWIVADRVVGAPLHLIISYIRGVVRFKEPWYSINSQSGNFPLLTINQIYKCLCNLCDENKGMVFAQLESTDYDVRQRLILFLNKKQERNFLRLVKSRLSPSDTVILSNICWNQKLAETVYIGYFDGSKYHLLNSKANKEEEVEEITLSDIRRYVKGIFALYSGDRTFYESSYNKEYFSEEDRQVIDEILARPEGKPLDELYRRFEEYNRERRRELGLIDNPDEQGRPEALPREQEQDVGENPEEQPNAAQSPQKNEKKNAFIFELPNDYFDYKDQEQDRDNKIGDLEDVVINAGVLAFTDIIVALTYQYLRENGAPISFLVKEKDNLQLVADILAGKNRTNTNNVKWVNPNDKETEKVVLYLAFKLFKSQKGKYQRAYRLLLPQIQPSIDKNYASYGRNANSGLRQEINSILERPRKE